MVTAAQLLVLIKARDETTQVLQGVGNRVASFGAKASLAFAGVAGAAFAAKTVFVDAASDLNEAVSKANVTFGDSASLIQDFASDSAKSFGVSKRAANEYTATLGNILQAAGLTREESAGMSVDLTKLAADMASFNNIRFDDALQKIRAGLVGEAEPLRTVGVLLSEAAVSQKAYASGIAATGAKLTEAQKVQARYQIILEQTTNSQGDFARTSEGVANQQRILTARMEDLRAEIGTKLLPVTAELFEQFNSGIDVLYDVGAAVSFVNEKMQSFGGGISSVSDLMPPQIKMAGDLRDALHGDAGALGDFTIKATGLQGPMSAGTAAVGKFRDMLAGGADDDDTLEGRAKAAAGGLSLVRRGIDEMVSHAAAGQPRLSTLLSITEDELKDLTKEADTARDALHKMFTEPTLEEELTELAILNMRNELTLLEGKGDDVTASERDRADNLRNNLIPAAERQRDLTGLQRDIYTKQIEIQQGGIPTLDEWRARIDAQARSTGDLNDALGLVMRTKFVDWVLEQRDAWQGWLDDIRNAADALREAPWRQGAEERGTGMRRFFGSGGTVGGDLGAPQLAIVHGGERVLTPAQQRAGGTAGAGVVIHMENHFAIDAGMNEEQLRKAARIYTEELNHSLRLTGLQGSWAGGGGFSP